MLRSCRYRWKSWCHRTIFIGTWNVAWIRAFLRELVQETYASKGRPSIDPVVFFKLQLVMFFEDIRSERLLMCHAADRLSVRWYLGYDLAEALPDHSSYQVSTTDPDATIMRSKGGVDLGYHTHYVVDGGKARIIVVALVTPSEVMDNQPMLDLLWRTRFRWKLWPRQVTGDKKYGSEENLVAIEDQGIGAYIPVPDVDHRTEFFSVEDFTYDGERDVYTCPAGKELHLAPWHSTERQLRYRAFAKGCNHCPLKTKCTTSKQGRSLCRSVDEASLERVRAYQHTEPYQKALRKRQVWVEPLFAEGKDWHGMRRVRLRRL